MLIELGATQLIEMGDARLGGSQSQIQSPVLDLFQVVNFLEDPYTGIDLDPGDSISPKQKAIAERLRVISKMTRKSLVGLYGLGELPEEARNLSRILNEISLGSYDLGKKKKGFLKKVGGKIMKVVKSPAFLTVVGIVANIVPGVGQIASAALLATAGIMAKKQQEAKQKTAIKKAEGQQAAAEQQAQGQQIDAYYGQYGASHFAPLGYTPDVWAKLTVAQKTEAAQSLSAGTLKPYATVSGQTNEVAKAAALSIAMKNEYGNQLSGQGIDLNTLPPDVRAQAEALAPQYEKQIEATGKDNFLATARKAVGQGSAINSFFRGAGAELPGGLGDMFSRFDDEKAKKAGAQDIENAGAAVGGADTVGGLLETGAGGIPWKIVGISAGGLVLVTGIILIARR